MRVSPALLLLVAACSFDRSGHGAGDGAVPDGNHPPIDADPNAIDADPNAIDAASPDAGSTCTGWAAANVDPCDPALPGATTLTLSGADYTLDTATGTLASGITEEQLPAVVLPQQGGPDVLAVNLTAFTLDADATLTVTGPHPLVLIVHGDASIDGSIEVGSTRDITGATTPGPGGNDVTVCATGTGGRGVASTGAGGGGGGGGGAYGDDGGNGTDGNGGGHGAKGTKGLKSGTAAITPLRGGCAGGPGGDDSNGAIDSSGDGGDGGGALEVTAAGTISVTGTISAGATGGGEGNLARAGGGGGGAGGAILLDGDVASVASGASLCANGGGGGEGGQIGLFSDRGEDAWCAELSALGGANNSEGGDGGEGGVLGATAGQAAATASNGAGGGGGGGGVGRIRVHGRTTRTVDNNATVTPAPST